jgi:hypothetical protein
MRVPRASRIGGKAARVSALKGAGWLEGSPTARCAASARTVSRPQLEQRLAPAGKLL